jgi:hypothetical protein
VLTLILSTLPTASVTAITGVTALHAQHAALAVILAIRQNACTVSILTQSLIQVFTIALATLTTS